ncbi:MAG: DUF3472 domain-containing protein, partial [Akkermansia sp.]
FRSSTMNLITGLFAFMCLTSTVTWADQITPVELAKRQCRSVHMLHGGIPEQSQAIYIEAEAIETAPGTYFCAANFDDGYIGFQDKVDKRIVIFSVWDPISYGNNPNDVPENERTGLIKAGDKTETSRFGGEGTGGKSMQDYNWKIGETMRFLVINNKINDKIKQISGYFYNNELKKWELIATWQTHRSGREISFAASFVEDFRRNYESALLVRSANYGPCFALDKNNTWVATKSGWFGADKTPSENIAAKEIPEKNAFKIQTGGNTVTDPAFKLNQTVKLPEPQKITAPDQETQTLVSDVLKQA